MRFKKRRYGQRTQLIEALTIIAMFAASIGGYLGLKFFLNTSLPLFVVASGSMSPTLEVGDVVIVQGVNASLIQEGDIIVFSETANNYTTSTVHRVVGIQVLPNKTRVFTTKGDNSTSQDSTPVPEYWVDGWVIFRIPVLGYLALDPTVPLAFTMMTLLVILIWPEKQRRRRNPRLPPARRRYNVRTLTGNARVFFSFS
ncbi:MAG: signal peptidase I [Candidatus Bathyarchaeota archaeon]|nr:signal peptidase I [Candidatus Bathyarchaeota archaeon]